MATPCPKHQGRHSGKRNSFRGSGRTAWRKKEDIHVDIDGALVTIKAEIRQQDSSAAGARNLRTERYYGSVARRFELPAEIDLEQADARYEEGLLYLQLPKRKAVESSRKLNIK